MRKFKRIVSGLCMLLLSALMLPGCGGPEGSEGESYGTQRAEGTDITPQGGAKGRFLETELAMPEHISQVLGVRKCEDGSIVLFGYDENQITLYRAISENQGQDWVETSLEFGVYRLAAVGEDGSAALLGYGMSEDDRDVFLVDPEGKTSYVHLNMSEVSGYGEMSNQILSAAYTAGKLFVVDLSQKIYEVDLTGSTTVGSMREFTKAIAEDVHDILPLNGRLAALTSNGVRFLNTDDGTLCEEDEVLTQALGVVENNTDSAQFSVIPTAGGSGDEIYFANHDGIFYHRNGASTVEQLANGELLSIGDASVTFRELSWFDDEHFVIFANDSLGNERCYRYVFDAEASAVPEKQLTVYALEDSTVLQQLVGAFQKSHPDVFVKKNIGMTGDDSVTAEDAIKTLNTEIMAGNGPDVLVLDGLPADSYIEKGILADIGDYVTAADEAEGLFTNITDAYRKDGALYQVPLRFFFAGLEWDEEVGPIAGTPAQTAARIESLKDGNGPVLTPVSAEVFLYAFYDACSASFRTESGIDEPALGESLKAAKTLYDLDGYEESERFSYGGFGPFMYQGQNIYGTISQGSMGRISGQAKVSVGTYSGVDEVCNLYGIENSRAGSFGLLCGEENRAFVPFLSLGLASQAKDSELAQSFIQMALTAEGQSQMTVHFSVNRKAYENECRKVKPYSISTSGADGESCGYEVKPLSEEQMQELTAMLESLNTPMWSDRVVQELFIGEGVKYLQGQQSFEDTVSAIAKKVQLYVSE